MYVIVELFNRTAAAIREEFGLSLFGFDVIIPTVELCSPEDNSSVPCSCSCSLLHESDVCSCSCRGERSSGEESESYASSIEGEHFRKPMVIDINYFPSYKEVSDFPMKLRKFLRKKASGAC